MSRAKYSIRRILSKKILLACIAVLVLCVSVMAVGLHYTNQNLIQTHSSETHKKLSLVAAAVNQQIDSTYASVVQMQSNEAVKAISRVAKYPLDSRAYMRLLEASEDIENRCLTGGVVYEYALINDKANIGLTSTRILHDLAFEYKSGLFAIEGLSYEEFLQEYVSADLNSHENGLYHPVCTLKTVNGKTHSVLIGSFSGASSHSENRFVSMLVIDMEYIMDRLQPLLINGECDLLISDDRGNILYTTMENDVPAESMNEAITKFADGYIVNVYSGGMTNLSFHIYTPNALLTKSTAPLLNIIYFMLVTAFGLLLFVLAYGLILSSRHMTRIAGILEMEPSSQLSDLQSVEAAIAQVCANNHQMSGTLTTLEISLRAGILESMYKGGILHAEEMNLAPEICENLPQKYHSCVLHWQPYGENGLNDILMRATALLSRFYISEFIHPCTAQSVAFIVDAEALDIALLENIAVKLGENTEAIVTVAIGGAASGPNGMHTSYIEAQSAQKSMKEHTVKRVVCWDVDSLENKNEYSFTIDQMLKIVLSVDSADKHLMTALMKAVYDRNFKNRRYSDEELTQYNHDLSIVHAKCSANAKKSGALPLTLPRDNSPAYNAESIFDMYLNLFSDMIDGLTQMHSTQKSSLFDDIKRYIDENYSNEDMSLKLVGAQFGITDKFVSMLFSTNSDVSFSKYVEDKRLEVAILALNDADTPINEIQKRCGYSTPSTFYKAFKRRYGLSPSEYRSQKMPGNVSQE